MHITHQGEKKEKTNKVKKGKQQGAKIICPFDKHQGGLSQETVDHL